MSKSDDFENNLLKLIYTAVAWANVADNAASSPKTAVYYALHSSTPGESGTQATNEIAYTSYIRKDKTRDTNGTTGHTVTANSVSTNTNITFAAGTGGSGTATDYSTGFGSSGATAYLHTGTITPSIVCGSGVTPVLTSATAETED